MQESVHEEEQLQDDDDYEYEYDYEEDEDFEIPADDSTPVRKESQPKNALPDVEDEFKVTPENQSAVKADVFDYADHDGQNVEVLSFGNVEVLPSSALEPECKMIVEHPSEGNYSTNRVVEHYSSSKKASNSP